MQSGRRLETLIYIRSWIQSGFLLVDVAGAAVQVGWSQHKMKRGPETWVRSRWPTC